MAFFSLCEVAIIIFSTISIIVTGAVVFSYWLSLSSFLFLVQG